MVLGGDDDGVAPAPECLADGPLAVVVAVEDCTVDVVDARVEGAVDHRDGFFAVDFSVCHGQAHRAKTENGCLQTRAAKHSILQFEGSLFGRG